VKLDLEENSDDIWNVFNIIGVGDIVYATCRRRVSKENAVGMTKQEVKVFNAYIRVQVRIRKSKHDINPLPLFLCFLNRNLSTTLMWML
jgi:stalled ribosome rescue protein Dom34